MATHPFSGLVGVILRARSGGGLHCVITDAVKAGEGTTLISRVHARVPQKGGARGVRYAPENSHSVLDTHTRFRTTMRTCFSI
eukprot:3936105-Rhodomonas_salina.1